MKIVNLTHWTVTLNNGMEFEPSGGGNFVKTIYKESKPLFGNIPVFETKHRFGGWNPPVIDDVYYIVLPNMAWFFPRFDFITTPNNHPDNIRKKGKIISYAGFELCGDSTIQHEN